MGVVSVALGELGYKEEPNKSTKYGKWYADGKFDRLAWCAMFVSWVYENAGTPLPAINDSDGFRYCPSMLNWARTNKRITHDPKPGDIVLFDWNKDTKSDHTGIFLEWANFEKTVIVTVEGNTSLSNQSNGGAVMKRKRKISLVQAFISPFEEQGWEVSLNSKGYLVKLVQNALKKNGFNVVVDGDFGAETHNAVVKYQTSKGLTPDGVVGPITQKSLLI